MTTPEYTQGLTFEKVWVMFQETDKKFQETDRMIKESAERQKETDRMMKETTQRIGELGSRFGELAAHLVAPNIMNKFNELDFNFTKCGTSVIIKEPGNLNPIAEVDIMLENGDVVIAVEVKAKPRKDDITDHIERMDRLRRTANLRQDNRRYQGAIAGAIMGNEIRSNILKQGFYLIEQTGDTVQISIPSGFKPREW